MQQVHLLGRSIAISQVEMKSDRMQQNAAGPTTRIVDFYKSGVVDANKVKKFHWFQMSLLENVL